MNRSYELVPSCGESRVPEPRRAAARSWEGQSVPVEPEADRLADYAAMLGRRKLALFLITLLCALVALGVSLLQAPAYRATASIEVEGVNENFLNLKDVNATANPTPASPEGPVNTEAESLLEESLIERVVLDLGLTRHAEFLPGKGLLSSLKRRVGLESPVPAAGYLANAIAVVKGHLNIETPRQGRIIRIHYESHDPALAASVANTLARTLIQQRLETRWNATEKISEWLDPQIAGLKRNLAQSEEELQRYALSQGLIFTGSLESTGDQNLRLLQEELARSRADRILKQSQYETAKAGQPSLAASGEENRVLQENQIKLTDLRRQLGELGSVLKPENYRVERVQAQIVAMEAAQREEQERVGQRIEKEYTTAQTREQLLARAYAQQAELVSGQSIKATRFESLKREVEVNRRVYEAMMQKAREAGIASAIQPSNIRLITAAKPPIRPFKPNLPLNLGVGVFAGLVFGITYVVASAQVDRKLRSPGQAGRYLNLPELGTIPRAGRGFAGRLTGAEGRSGEVELATAGRRSSIFSESFRTALASLLYTSGGSGSPAAFVVTSPLPGEGKTTVVANLGIALAEINRRVLLVDADLRAPRLHKVFSLENEAGVADLLTGDACPTDGAIKSLIRPTSVPNLWVLTSGLAVDRAASLLHAPVMEHILRYLRKNFDHVIVDAPPTLLFADARIIARSADGVLLVLRANRTSWPSAVAAAQRLQSDGAPILGTILNDWSPGMDAGTYGYRHLRRYYSAR